MAGHGERVGWLERWREQEPLRLYLWTVAAAVLVAGVSTGLLTETWALAGGGVAAAVLMMGGTAAARREAYAPATVHQLLTSRDAQVERLLDDQHAASFHLGVEEMHRWLEERAVQLPGDLDTAEMAPQTARIRAQGRCRHVDDRRRCLLPRHPENIDHRLEGAGAQE